MKPAGKVALIAVTDRGVSQARLLRGRLKRGELFRPARYGLPADPWEHTFAEPLADHVPALFAAFDQLVFFLAVGAVTRLIAPCLVSKATDPGVLAVDEAGQFVIPVLSGHKGGANAFARLVAGCLGAMPVITTASDVVGGLSPDLLSEEYNWVAEPAERLKDAALALVNRVPVAILQEIGCRGGWLEEKALPDNVTVMPGDAKPQAAAMVLWITDQTHSGLSEERILWYRPKSLVLDVG